MTGRFLSFKRNNRGVAAVEFALILPVMAIMLVGLADYGMIINEEMQMQDLARSAAEYVVLGGSSSNVTSAVLENNAFYNQLVANSQAVTYSGTEECQCQNGSSVSCSGSCTATGDYVRRFFTVSLSSTYTTILPYPGFPSTIAVTGSSILQY